jgi:hypothetical protein
VPVKGVGGKAVRAEQLERVLPMRAGVSKQCLNKRSPVALPAKRPVDAQGVERGYFISAVAKMSKTHYLTVLLGNKQPAPPNCLGELRAASKAEFPLVAVGHGLTGIDVLCCRRADADHDFLGF